LEEEAPVPEASAGTSSELPTYAPSKVPVLYVYHAGGTVSIFQKRAMRTNCSHHYFKKECWVRDIRLAGYPAVFVYPISGRIPDITCRISSQPDMRKTGYPAGYPAKYSAR